MMKKTQSMRVCMGDGEPAIVAQNLIGFQPLDLVGATAYRRRAVLAFAENDSQRPVLVGLLGTAPGSSKTGLVKGFPYNPRGYSPTPERVLRWAMKERDVPYGSIAATPI